MARDQRKDDGEDDGEQKEDGDDGKEYDAKNLGYQYGGSPPFLLDFEGTIGERHAENKEIVANESFGSYQSILSVAVQIENEQMAQLMQSMKYIVG